MSDDIELPYGPLHFVSAIEYDKVLAERDELRGRIAGTLRLLEGAEAGACWQVAAAVRILEYGGQP